MIVITILVLWSNGRLKYMTEPKIVEKPEKSEKKVSFKEAPASAPITNDDVDKEIEAINAS
jgi:hypothetical protein